MVGQHLNPEMLTALDSTQLARQSSDALVIVAMSLADDLEYARDGLGDGRALVLVQGTNSWPPSDTVRPETPTPNHLRRLA